MEVFIMTIRNLWVITTGMKGMNIVVVNENLQEIDRFTISAEGFSKMREYGDCEVVAINLETNCVTIVKR